MDIYPTLTPETYRCHRCPYCEISQKDSIWVYDGCYHKPYNGEWVGDIKDCPKEVTMTIDEVIYCLTSYLPDKEVEHCVSCPYYESGCKSSEAHKFAIDALLNLKEAKE